MIQSHLWGRRNQEVIKDIYIRFYFRRFLSHSYLRITALNLEAMVRHELLKGFHINGFFLCFPDFSEGC